jgi:hypothetical protein
MEYHTKAAPREESRVILGLEGIDELNTIGEPDQNAEGQRLEKKTHCTDGAQLANTLLLKKKDFYF